MNHILILNGPNLNMLGKREPEIYGSQTLADIEAECATYAKAHNLTIDFRQSNHEGELVTWLQDEMGKADAILINAAAYTHTSVAIHDALKLHSCPIIEVHLSDPKTREEFRHFSYIAPLAAHIIAGRGAKGYIDALEIALQTIEKT
ncbi:MAG: type II 3-dehydroquinate dehydratase [Pseudobdellovibrionaceae bacterium]